MNSYHNGFQRFPQLLCKYEYFPQRFPRLLNGGAVRLRVGLAWQGREARLPALPGKPHPAAHRASPFPWSRARCGAPRLPALPGKPAIPKEAWKASLRDFKEPKKKGDNLLLL